MGINYVFLLCRYQQSEVEQELDDLCSKLGALGDECKTVVNEFLPQILKMISDEIVSSVVCVCV